MKTVWIVEYGSNYDDEPWKIKGVFKTEELADAFIRMSFCPSLFHKSEWQVVEE